MKQNKKEVILILMVLMAVVLFFILYVDLGRRTTSETVSYTHLTLPTMATV